MDGRKAEMGISADSSKENMNTDFTAAPTFNDVPIVRTGLSLRVV